MSTPSTVPQSALPSNLTPDALDTLPVLSAILSRLQTPASTSNPSNSLQSGSPAPENTAGTLAIKDIPTATDELKYKLKKARATAKELPDVDRSLEEQEEEIRELEEKIERQRGVLEGLRESGRAARVGFGGGD